MLMLESYRVQRHTSFPEQVSFRLCRVGTRYVAETPLPIIMYVRHIPSRRETERS